MSLIEKIDAVSNEHPYKVVGDTDTYGQYNEGWADACDRLTAVLSEQKEPCTGSKICPKCNRVMSYDSYFKKMICCQCGHEEEPQPKPLTTGDKIRESNESLAQHLIGTSYSCEQCIFKCYDENLEIVCAWGRKTTCKDGILQYLNQPYTE